MTKILQPSLVCPSCGEDAGVAAEVSGPGGKMSPGDLSVCCYCGGLSVYGYGRQLRKAEVSDIAKLGPMEIQELARVRKRFIELRSLRSKT